MLACHSRGPALDRPLTSFAPPCVCPGAARRITLGMLVQTSGSVNKVVSSLSIVSENWGGINEWRSTVVRLQQFERELFAGPVERRAPRRRERPRPSSSTRRHTTIYETAWGGHGRRQ